MLSSGTAEDGASSAWPGTGPPKPAWKGVCVSGSGTHHLEVWGRKRDCECLEYGPLFVREAIWGEGVCQAVAPGLVPEGTSDGGQGGNPGEGQASGQACEKWLEGGTRVFCSSSLGGQPCWRASCPFNHRPHPGVRRWMKMGQKSITSGRILSGHLAPTRHVGARKILSVCVFTCVHVIVQ